MGDPVFSRYIKTCSFPQGGRLHRRQGGLCTKNSQRRSGRAAWRRGEKRGGQAICNFLESCEQDGTKGETWVYRRFQAYALLLASYSSHPAGFSPCAPLCSTGAHGRQ
ncbi:hypothetical protein MRX96_012371 [Rhipicephalus microplus]